ncbi:MAG TPA: ribonuclease domain-containing protein [Casimicrobiaceae bacterium]|nr:ribonuclease domain-containing protein [Casimicrobiaceae bacterium]
MRRAIALLLAAALIAALGSESAIARSRPPVAAEVAVAELPPHAREVLARIRNGGPFRYDRDGVVFGNREGLLPARPRGYYHEYTVPTPGVKGRGAQRIVCGGPMTAPDVCFYSDDHYRSFRRIRT